MTMTCTFRLLEAGKLNLNTCSKLQARKGVDSERKHMWCKSDTDGRYQFSRNKKCNDGEGRNTHLKKKLHRLKTLPLLSFDIFASN